MPLEGMLEWSGLDATWQWVRYNGVDLIIGWVCFWTLYMAFALIPLVRSCEKRWLRRRRKKLSPTLPAIVRHEWTRETFGLWLLPLPLPVMLCGLSAWVTSNAMADFGYHLAGSMPYWSAIVFVVSGALFVLHRRLAEPTQARQREPEPGQNVPYKPRADSGRIATIRATKGRP